MVEEKEELDKRVERRRRTGISGTDGDRRRVLRRTWMRRFFQTTSASKLMAEYRYGAGVSAGGGDILRKAD